MEIIIINKLQKVINNNNIDINLILNKIMCRLYPNITDDELDEELASICVNLSTINPIYSNLGGKILVFNLHNKTLNTFTDKMKLIPSINKEWLKYVIENEDEFNSIINYEQDYIYDYFGFKTLTKLYLLKNNDIIIERPQDMLLRTAITVQKGNIELIKKTYLQLSQGKYIHASPTLFNAGTNNMQLSSCFLLGTNDNIDDIADTINSCMQISKWAGGIGLHISNIRSKNSIINGTGGKSKGIIPFIKVLNELSRWIDQGGKRPGSISIYLELHHPDILDFLNLKKNFGSETERARDLFYALWISDLFMKCVENDDEWYLLNPNECNNLTETYGEKYEKLYYKYVNENKYIKKLKARHIWINILEIQIETGMPYMLYKDTINTNNNQKNLGVIKSSNLCVHGDTKILTNKGYIKIEELKNTKVILWNGEEWSETIVKQTGINQDLIRIKFSNGAYIDCTKEHKFFIYDNNNIIKINACELNIGNEIIKLNLPLLNKDNISVYLNQKQIDEIIIRIENINDLLEKRLLLHTLGIDSQIINNELVLNNDNLNKLRNINIKLNFKEYNIDNIYVVSIEDSYKNVNTYCFTEPLKNMGVFNGILCGNCAEIVQYSDHNEIAVCNLASIALNKFVNKFNYSLLNNLVIYTKDNCIYCTYAKTYLNNNNVIFTEKKYSMENLNYLKQILDNNTITFPQIFNNNILIGGWEDLYNFTKGNYNFDELYETAYLATLNLNNIIDINFYPINKARISNLKHRPVGLGIQGLADTLVLLNICYDSEESIEFNKKMMETIYYASLNASNKIAKDRYYKLLNFKNINLPLYYDESFIMKDINLNNLYHELKVHNFELETNFIGAYSSFEGSLFSEGKFQFNMYSNNINLNYDWDILRNNILKYGTRNSLLTALMPTASTSQLLGNNECFEFFTNNIYTRKTQAGDFILVNKYLINDLIKLGLWNNELKDLIIAYNGSIQSINNIPINIKKLYKNIWEIKQIWTLKNAIARSYFVDQTQSMNIFMDIPDYQRLSSCHFYSWKNKLKTGMYYLRSKPSSNAVKITIDPNIINNTCLNCSG